LPPLQSASLAQVVGQLAELPLHLYGVQAGDPAPPADTNRHVPVEHVSHGPPHAVLQQTLSTQLPPGH